MAGTETRENFPPLRFPKTRSPLALAPPDCLASIYALAKQQPRWFVAAEVGHKFSVVEEMTVWRKPAHWETLGNKSERGCFVIVS